jgi:hypothetical protein
MASESRNSPGDRSLPGSTPDGAECVFHRQADGWTLAFEGKVARLRDSKGLRYIATLLRHAGDDLSVGELGNLPHGPGAASIDEASRERLRKAVASRINDTIGLIERENAALATHLRKAIRTGSHCSYAPGRTVPWRF